MLRNTDDPVVVRAAAALTTSYVKATAAQSKGFETRGASHVEYEFEFTKASSSGFAWTAYEGDDATASSTWWEVPEEDMVAGKTLQLERNVDPPSGATMKRCISIWTPAKYSIIAVKARTNGSGTSMKVSARRIFHGNG